MKVNVGRWYAVKGRTSAHVPSITLRADLLERPVRFLYSICTCNNTLAQFVYNKMFILLEILFPRYLCRGFMYRCLMAISSVLSFAIFFKMYDWYVSFVYPKLIA